MKNNFTKLNCRHYILLALLIGGNGIVNAQERTTAATDTTLPPAAIVLNQLGFYPAAPKIAVIRNGPVHKRFYLIDVLTQDTVYKGELLPVATTTKMIFSTLVADFSVFKKAGRFRLVTDRIARQQLVSQEILIAPAVHRGLAAAALKGFYYQRSSGELRKQFAGDWARAAGHPDTAVLVHSSAAGPSRPAGTKISSPGGWYDAGDYNKYIVNSGITMGTMMSAYEDFGPWFDKLRLNIPESGNQLPDILDEVAYNLRWMLTMQDPEDGGVYHKCTNAAFDGNVMPGVTRLPRYVVQKSTAATLDFAAVMAQAARVFNMDTDNGKKLGLECLAAAKRAWTWSLANPAMLYNQDSMNKIHQPAITTGAYGDRVLDDEWYWAASELYVSTGEQIFLQHIKAGPRLPASLPGWATVRTMGTYSLLRHEARIRGFNHNSDTTITTLISGLKSDIVNLASKYLSEKSNSQFLTVMGSRKSDFNWGSNANAANQGILLLNAWKITRDPKLLEAALFNLDYICGRNATGYCFVTGFGSRSTMHPHHRPSVSDNVVAPVPGLMAGGPNSGMQDKCYYQYTEPALAYTDEFCSYASNEIAINWNAPLVYLAGAMEAIAASVYSGQAPK